MINKRIMMTAVMDLEPEPEPEPEPARGRRSRRGAVVALDASKADVGALEATVTPPPRERRRRERRPRPKKKLTTICFELLPPVQQAPEPEPEPEPDEPARPPTPEPLPEDLDELRPFAIKKLVRQRGLDAKGPKDELLRRLRDHDAELEREKERRERKAERKAAKARGEKRETGDRDDGRRGGRGDRRGRAAQPGSEEESDSDDEEARREGAQQAQELVIAAERDAWDAGGGAASVRRIADDFSTADGIPGLLPGGNAWFRVATAGRDSVVPGRLSLRQLKVGFEVLVLPEDKEDTFEAMQNLVAQVADPRFKPPPRRIRKTGEEEEDAEEEDVDPEEIARREVAVAEADRDVEEAKRVLENHKRSSNTGGRRGKSDLRAAETALQEAQDRAREGRTGPADEPDVLDDLEDLEDLEDLVEEDEGEDRDGPGEAPEYMRFGGARVVSIEPAGTHYGWTSLRKSGRVWRVVDKEDSRALQLVDLEAPSDVQRVGEAARRRERWVAALESRSTVADVSGYYGMPRLVDWYSRGGTVAINLADPPEQDEDGEESKSTEAVLTSAAMRERDEPPLARYYGVAGPDMLRFYSNPTPAFKNASASSHEPGQANLGKQIEQQQERVLDDFSDLDALADLDSGGESEGDLDELDALADLENLDLLMGGASEAVEGGLDGMDGLEELAGLDVTDSENKATAAEKKEKEEEEEVVDVEVRRREPVLLRFYGSGSRRPATHPVVSYYSYALDGIDGKGDYLQGPSQDDDVAAAVADNVLSEVDSDDDNGSWISVATDEDLEHEAEAENLPPPPPLNPPAPLHKQLELFGFGLLELAATEFPFSSHLPTSLPKLRELAELIHNDDDGACRFCQQCSRVFGRDTGRSMLVSKPPPTTSRWQVEILPPPADTSKGKRGAQKPPTEKTAAEAWHAVEAHANEAGGLMVAHLRSHVDADATAGAEEEHGPADKSKSDALFGGTTLGRVVCPRGCALFRSTPSVPEALVDAVDWSLKVAESQERLWLAEVSCRAFSARNIQRGWYWWKVEVARKALEVAVGRVQRFVRRRNQERWVRARVSACLKLQPVVRGRICRERLQEEREERAAARMAATWRGFIQRTNLREQCGGGRIDAVALAHAAPLPVVVKLLAARRKAQPRAAPKHRIIDTLTIVPPQRPGRQLLFDEERGCDVELIVADGQTMVRFWCHRAILSGESGYFNALFTGNREPKYSNRMVQIPVHLPATTVPDASAEAVRHALCWIYGHRFVVDRRSVVSLYTLAVDLACDSLTECCATAAVDSRFVRAENAVSCYVQACKARHGQPLGDCYWKWMIAHARGIADEDPSAVAALSPVMARHFVAAAAASAEGLDDGGAASKLALRIAVHWAAAGTRKVHDVSEVFRGCKWHASAGHLFPALPGGPGYGEEDGVVEGSVWKHLVHRMSDDKRLWPTGAEGAAGEAFGDDTSDEDTPDTSDEADAKAAAVVGTLVEGTSKRPSPPPLPSVEKQQEEDEALDEFEVERLLSVVSLAAAEKSLREDIRLAAGLVPLRKPASSEKLKPAGTGSLSDRLLLDSVEVVADSVEAVTTERELEFPLEPVELQPQPQPQPEPEPELEPQLELQRRTGGSCKAVPLPLRPAVDKHGRRFAFQWSAVPKNLAMKDNQVDETALAAELALRAELVVLSLPELQQRAFLERVDATAVADASLDFEESEAKRAIVMLVVEHLVSSTAAGEEASADHHGEKNRVLRMRRGPPAPARPPTSPYSSPFGRGVETAAAEAVALRRVAATSLEPSLRRLSSLK